MVVPQRARCAGYCRSTLAMRWSVFLEGVGLHHVGAWSLRSILEDKENTVVVVRVLAHGRAQRLYVRGWVGV